VVTEVDRKASNAQVAFGPDHRAVVQLEDVSWARKPDPRRLPTKVERIDAVFHVGDVARFALADSDEADLPTPRVTLYQKPQVQGGLLSIELETRDVIALVGGYDFDDSQFNRVTQAVRQPGSAFKPIIYGAALSLVDEDHEALRRFTPASIVYDRPKVYTDHESGFIWKPKNYGREFYGPITLRKARIERVLGMLPDPEEVADILERLGMAVTAVDDGWQVIPPTYRFDIAIEADLIEEIGRVYGYDRLPLQPLIGALDIQPLSETALSVQQVAKVLVARGYQEAVTYSFVDPDFQSVVNPGMQAIALANPISTEMSVMRTSLWPGLMKAAAYNLNRQKNRLRFFEHGLRFFIEDNNIKQDIVLAGLVSGSRMPEHWTGVSEPVDFYDIKGDVEAILALTGRRGDYHFVAAMHPALHPGQCAVIRLHGRDIGWVGRVHPLLAGQHDLEPATLLFQLEFAALEEGSLAQFSSISRYPSIRRDLAVVVDAAITVDDLCREARNAAGELLKELVIFDVYQGKGIETGRKSIAFGLILQDSSRTLTDQDTESLVARVTQQLGDTIGATLRE